MVCSFFFFFFFFFFVSFSLSLSLSLSLSFSISFSYSYSYSKLCGVEQRALPIFGRATITLDIGPHFWLLFFLIVVFIYSALKLQDCLINLLVKLTRYSLFVKSVCGRMPRCGLFSNYIDHLFRFLRNTGGFIKKFCVSKFWAYL